MKQRARTNEEVSLRDKRFDRVIRAETAVPTSVDFPLKQTYTFRKSTEPSSFYRIESGDRSPKIPEPEQTFRFVQIQQGTKTQHCFVPSSSFNPDTAGNCENVGQCQGRQQTRLEIAFILQESQHRGDRDDSFLHGKESRGNRLT